jgi:hypothetical protein
MLDEVGNNGYPTSAFPLQECQGDCDHDSDCAGNLKCFKRDAQELVVGCYGKGESSTDYCYNPVLELGGCIKAKEAPGYKAEGWDYDEKYGQLVQDMKAYMHGLIVDSEDEMIPKFLRLGFHDSVGGIMDGCVDLNDGDNKGLLEPMEVLKGCPAHFKHMVSRADCWAMATIAASEAAAAKDPNVPADLEYPYTFIGRCDCVEADDIGHPGPKRELPSPDLPTDGVIDYFSDHYGHTIGNKMPIEKYVVVALGSHAASVAHRVNSGFGNIHPETHRLREDGWVKNADDYVLSHEYYVSLADPQWHMQFLPNGEETKVITDEGENKTMADFSVLPRMQWYIDPEGKNVVMTGSDISMFVDFNDFLIEDKDGVPGLVTCLFSDEGEFDVEMEERLPEGAEFVSDTLCPSATQTVPFVHEYIADNHLFHHDFAEVIDIMINNGYVEY